MVQNVFKEIIDKNFPNFLKTNLHIEEAQQIPSRVNTKLSTCSNIIVKLIKIKDKEKFLKAAKEDNLQTRKQ